MAVKDGTLSDLRREIDEIDNAMHDLLMRRAEIVERVARTKDGERVFMRPAREAEILRRLAARHKGRFPVPVVMRVWRELLAGFTQIQGPFAVAVHAPEHSSDLWDVARDHYGSTTPITAVSAPVAAVRSVIDGTATVAVVPWPDDRDSDPWWRALLSDDPKSPSVIARLPFVAPARGDDWGGLAVAQVPHEPTGDDHTLIAVELTEPLSRGRLKEALEGSGLPPVAFWSCGPNEQQATPLHLIEVGGFIAPSDGQLNRLSERLGQDGLRVKAIGGFAMPVQLPSEDSAPATKADETA